VYDYDMVNPADWDVGIRSPTADCFTPSHGPGQACTNATAPTPPTYYWSNPFSDAKIVANLSNAGSAYGNQNTLKTDIGNYVSAGGTDYAAGINAAISELSTWGNPTHNQSIIIMGDGINMMAPIANGSFESYWPSDWYPRPTLTYLDESDVGKAASIASATVAKNKGITIYGIGFSTDDYYDNLINDMPFFTQLPSPGCYYFAPTSNQMNSIFNQIEGQIQTTAGVNTTMVINLQNVYVTYNNVTTGYNGSQVFNYVYNPASSTQITDQNGNTYVINQTSQWLNNQTLIFNIGTMTVGQKWSTTFEMQLLKPGSVSPIGNQSSITFGTGESMSLNPGTPITGAENYSNTGFNMPTISITNLQALQNSTITNIVPLQWNITYPGNEYATEDVYYNSVSDPTWKFIYQQPINPGNWTQEYSWNVGSLPPGEYSIEVLAYAQDADSGKEIITYPIAVGESTKAFIKIQ
jgi:hypothetical protein